MIINNDVNNYNNKIKYKEIIESLCNEYVNNEQVLDKIHTIVTSLPQTIYNYHDTLIKKEEKTAQIKKEQIEFKEKFLKSNPYFYSSSTSRFFVYDGNHYSTINENDIQYNLYTRLSENKQLTNVKYKTQSNTIKEIKQTRNILHTIPESFTINFVKKALCPLLFTSYGELKYFMFVIGSMILKQQDDYVYFIHPLCKPIMSHIENRIMDTLSVNIYDKVKIKYHSHNIQKCRLINMNKMYEMNEGFINFFYNYCLDFICVSCYYFKKYKTEKTILKNISNRNEIKYILYLSNEGVDNIVKKFNSKFLISSSSDNVISSKNMTFLWKWFLDIEKIPNVLSLTNLKDKLGKHIPYNNNIDCYTHIQSPLFDSSQKFINFCKNNVILSDNNNDELDISELIEIFKDEVPDDDIINENVVIKILKHSLLPYTYNNNNKTIMNIYTLLWNKRNEVESTIKEYIIENLDNNEQLYNNIVDNEKIHCYESYKRYIEKDYKYVANKRYYEKLYFNIIMK